MLEQKKFTCRFLSMIDHIPVQKQVKKWREMHYQNQSPEALCSMRRNVVKVPSKVSFLLRLQQWLLVDHRYGQNICLGIDYSCLLLWWWLLRQLIDPLLFFLLSLFVVFFLVELDAESSIHNLLFCRVKNVRCVNTIWITTVDDKFLLFIEWETIVGSPRFHSLHAIFTRVDSVRCSINFTA